jgi:hypothetical protein
MVHSVDKKELLPIWKVLKKMRGFASYHLSTMAAQNSRFGLQVDGKMQRFKIIAVICWKHATERTPECIFASFAYPAA